jgi:hypothetical protein
MLFLGTIKGLSLKMLCKIGQIKNGIFHEEERKFHT